MYWESFSEKKSLLEQQFRSSKHLQMVTSFLFFFLLFYVSLFSLRVYLAIFRKNHSLRYIDLIQFVSRITSTVHAVVATVLAAKVLLTDKNLYENQLVYSSFQTALISNFVIGYMVFDLITMAKYKEVFEWQFLLHHIVSVSAFYASSIYGVFAYIALFRLTSEGSTLFINIRWTLLMLNKKHTKFYMWNGVLIIASFTIFRIIPILPIWWSFFGLLKLPLWPEVHIGFKFLCLGSSIPLDILNLYWYFKIVRMAVKLLNEVSSEPSSPIPSSKED